MGRRFWTEVKDAWYELWNNRDYSSIMVDNTQSLVNLSVFLFVSALTVLALRLAAAVN